MTRIRRAGYVFITRKADHAPWHVHVYRGDDLIVKWDLEEDKPITGMASTELVELIHDLRREGLL